MGFDWGGGGGQGVAAGVPCPKSTIDVWGGKPARMAGLRGLPKSKRSRECSRKGEEGVSEGWSMFVHRETCLRG